MASRGRRRASLSAVAVAVLGVLVVAGTAVGYASYSSDMDEAAKEAATAPPLETHAPAKVPNALWLGDSYTAGVGAGPERDGEACRASVLMGWNCMVDAQGATGFINNGHAAEETNQALPDRLTENLQRYIPDVVVLDVGRNDADDAATAKAARETIDRIQSQWPDADLVVIVPYFVVYGYEVKPDLAALFHRLGKAEGFAVVDPVAEGWITDDFPKRMIYNDNIHPNRAGHLYVARHLAEAFEAAGVGS